MSEVSWFADAVVYQVFVDRFHRGRTTPGESLPADTTPNFCGGNLWGVLEKLDYLQGLGINTLWLTPFCRTANYHGYHTTDFFAVEPRFGGEEALDALIAEAHRRGLRLMMDFAANHVHETHPWFLSAKADKKSPTRDYFTWRKDGSYKTYSNVTELPQLNLENPAARQALFDSAKHWLTRGFDAIRIDHAEGPTMDFWREFRRQMKTHKPSAPLIAEVWIPHLAPHDLDVINLPHKHLYFLLERLGNVALDRKMLEYREVFDGVLDFEFQRLLKTNVARQPARYTDAQVQKRLDRHYQKFPRGFFLPSFLDNHDMDRFLFDAGGDLARLHRALTIQCRQAQPIILYNGIEMGMSQTATVFDGSPYADLRVRGRMTWQRGATFELCKKLIAERKRA